MSELEARQALENAVAAIDRQIENLQKARQALVDVLGGTVAPVAIPSNMAQSPISGQAVGDPLARVREQEFHGMSMAEAARVFLQRAGAQKTGTILDAIRKGGVQPTGKFPDSALYTALSRHLGFVSLTKNWWDLAERRPDLAEEQRQRKRRPKVPKKRRAVKARHMERAKEVDFTEELRKSLLKPLRVEVQEE